MTHFFANLPEPFKNFPIFQKLVWSVILYLTQMFTSWIIRLNDSRYQNNRKGEKFVIWLDNPENKSLAFIDSLKTFERLPFGYERTVFNRNLYRSHPWKFLSKHAEMKTDGPAWLASSPKCRSFPSPIDIKGG